MDRSQATLATPFGRHVVADRSVFPMLPWKFFASRRLPYLRPLACATEYMCEASHYGITRRVANLRGAPVAPERYNRLRAAVE